MSVLRHFLLGHRETRHTGRNPEKAAYRSGLKDTGTFWETTRYLRPGFAVPRHTWVGGYEASG
jgi:hypothetical protein